ncbi:glyoxalase [Rhizobium leguminosarum]|nr:glyoxalase [Rhizobium leguminosarum]TAU86355.1 glyoxalase [Rhizobium leguminosarum]
MKEFKLSVFSALAASRRTRLVVASCLAIVLYITGPLNASAEQRAFGVGVGSQYTTTHVYVEPEDVDAFVRCFLATFGGQSTKQLVATLTPTPSKTTTQLLQTPSGTVSLFGFKTPIPWPFGRERTGYLVADIGMAEKSAVAAGADVLVAPFDDPIGKDMVIEWPGGVDMQLYWHNIPPKYEPFANIPEDRVYVSPVRIDDFLRSYLSFSGGRVMADDAASPGVQVGRPDQTFRRILIHSVFGEMVINVTDGHLPFPYGREKTGYKVPELAAAISRATANGANVLDGPYRSSGRDVALVRFPGGYIAEMHASAE